MANPTDDRVISELKTLNSMAGAGKDLHCEFDNLPRDQQLALTRAASRPENSAYVNNLKLVIDGDSCGLNMHLEGKTKATEACVAPDQAQDQSQLRQRMYGGQQGDSVAPDEAQSQAKFIARLRAGIRSAETFDPQPKASEIEKLVPADLKGDDASQGALRKKLCDLMQGDPANRDQVLAILEKDGATIERSNGQPVSIKFSQYWGARQDNIPLTMSFDELAKTSEQKFDAGVEQATHVSFTAASAIMRQQAKEQGTLTEAQKYWFEKPGTFH